MAQKNYILAARGRPFRDWDAAELKRQIISGELDDDGFEVVRHPQGGFAVARSGQDAPEPSRPDSKDMEPSYEVPEGPGDMLARESADNANGIDAGPEIGGVLPSMYAEDRPQQAPASDHDKYEATDAHGDRSVTLKGYSRDIPERFGLNVTPRAFTHLHILTAIGIVLILFPHLLLAPLGGFSGWQDPALGAPVLGTIQLAGILLAIGASGKFLYTYVFYRYEVTKDYVEAKMGFISRDAPKTYFAHIRSTNIVQAWWERILMVGAVKLGTGATDRHEVVLKHIAHPKRLEQELERRYLPFIRAQQRLID